MKAKRQFWMLGTIGVLAAIVLVIAKPWAPIRIPFELEQTSADDSTGQSPIEPYSGRVAVDFDEKGGLLVAVVTDVVNGEKPADHLFVLVSGGDDGWNQVDKRSLAKASKVGFRMGSLEAWDSEGHVILRATLREGGVPLTALAHHYGDLMSESPKEIVRTARDGRYFPFLDTGSCFGGGPGSRACGLLNNDKSRACTAYCSDEAGYYGCCRGVASCGCIAPGRL